MNDAIAAIKRALTPRAKADRSFGYNLADNIIGIDDGVDTPGERLGRGVTTMGYNFATDPLGTAGAIVMGAKRDLDNLMFEGGARERPEAVLGYAAAPMAPGAATGALLARTPNTLNAIKAWHGSPHDFDRFSMDKIGTGEGAQAYGHGLYFAETKDTAEAYRHALGRPKDMWQVSGPDGVRVGYRTRSGSEGQVGPFDPADGDIFMQADKAIQGRLYEVEIDANPEDFLDWDAPLSAQRGKAKNAVDDFFEWYAGPEGRQEMYDAGIELGDVQNQFDDLSPAQFSAAMRSRGVPGSKYRDAGSRGRPGGLGSDETRNYVVFDENLIRIVNKYGIAGAAAMLGVSAAEVEAAMAQGKPPQTFGYSNAR